MIIHGMKSAGRNFIVEEKLSETVMRILIGLFNKHLSQHTMFTNMKSKACLKLYGVKSAKILSEKLASV